MKDLVKNPIGIIGAFITLIYGFANILIKLTASSLTKNERYPLIFFIILFPFVVLFVFYRLVSRHHGKLYAPADYKDDGSFLKTIRFLSEEEREQKIERDVQEALESPTSLELQASQPTDNVSRQVSTEPLKQPRPEFDREAERERARAIRNEFELIESLVISKLEIEFNQQSRRDVAIGDTDISYDAVFDVGENLTLVEIKSLRQPNMAFSMILEKILLKALIANKRLKSNYKLIIVIVYYFSNEDLLRVRRNWQRQIEKTMLDVDLRFIDRNDLILKRTQLAR